MSLVQISSLARSKCHCINKFTGELIRDSRVQIIYEYFAVYFVQICVGAQIQSSIKGCDPNRKSPFWALSGGWTRLVGMRSCVHFLMTLNLVAELRSPKFRIRNPESFYFLLIPNINMLSYGILAIFRIRNANDPKSTLKMPPLAKRHWQKQWLKMTFTIRYG